MHGDFTRWTFDQAQSFRSVLMQQGRVVLDAEWNEQAKITAHHDESRARDIIGRAGGPAALDGGPGPFAIVDGTDGSRPDGAAWADLAVTPGSYYVDGVLAEAWPNPPGRGWPLGNQPYRSTIGAGVTADPGLAEPAAEEGDGRYVAHLDVWSHHVTGDERPALLEPALGGPDTATREQTVWQVRVSRIEDTDVCSTMATESWGTREPRLMAAGLRPPADDTDPCQISAAGGYQRLENQLYRVQIHDAGATPTFLWSRENGSVTAGLKEIGSTTVAGMDAELVMDRAGRDEELSIRQGDVVEVTSADRQLRGLKGFLATVGPTDDLVVAVAWLADAPTSRAALGRAPTVRRWEGGPTKLAVAAVDLEDGIFVRFPAGGIPATGDYWLVPARTVRLAYGINALRGTLDWPERSTGVPMDLPPRGPVHHLTPLAVLARTGELWSRESDCRHLCPPLTAMVSLDMVGGDGQEAMPGSWLPEPVRVVVRNGGLPVVGAPVRFTAHDGELDASESVASGTSPVTVTTDASGMASVHWRLDANGATTQTLEIRRLDDLAAGTGVQVIVTGRLSVAREVAWDPACQGFSKTVTVQDALARLATTADLSLLGGDGQSVTSHRQVVSQYVRVFLDSPCGPVEKATIFARATGRALVVPGKADQPVPSTLPGDATDEASFTTGPDGVALFAWQPSFGGSTSDVLDIFTKESGDAPIRVTAQMVTGGGDRIGGVHLTRIHFTSGPELVNDSQVAAADLARGLMVELDGPVVQETVQDKPVARVVLDLPWPIESDGEFWEEAPIGFRSVQLAAEINADGPLIVWRPVGRTSEWLRGRLWEMLRRIKWEEPIIGRFILDGWAIVAEDDRRLHVNGHASAAADNGQTLLELPTDDAVTGGQFQTWFRLVPERVVHDRPVIRVPSLVDMTRARAERLAVESGLVVNVIEEVAPGIRKNTVLATDPPEGVELAPGTPITIRVSSGLGG